jgi:hypothetical protein
MNPIKWSRVLLGGLVAGLVMNASEAALHGGMLGRDAQDLFRARGVPDTAEPWQLAALIGVTFVVGIAAVWLYAAIRPCYGPGPRTALCAGLVVWVLAHLWSGVYLGTGFTGLITEKNSDPSTVRC